jgi:hypothetical protein
MRAALFLLASLGAAASVLPAAATPVQRHPASASRAPGATRLGPWVEEGWRREDWSRAPAVRDWRYSAPANYDPLTGWPSSTAEYPWGYTTPFTRVGGKCVASAFNESPGGLVVRYQRVTPSYYCR